MPEYVKKVPGGVIEGYLPDYPGEVAELDKLVVDEACVGMGIGSMLLDAFVVEAILSRAVAIVGTMGGGYTSYTDRERLRAFYERHGFRVNERPGINPEIYKEL